MKIEVTHVGEPWTPPGSDNDPLYSIAITGYGEPQKTYDKALAVVGEHEAESYQSKSGKTYWRKPKETRKFEKVYKADPEKQESIEWQACLKAAVETVMHYNLHFATDKHKGKTLEEYKQDVVNTLITYTRALELKPDSIITKETITDAGDFAKINEEVLS